MALGSVLFEAEKEMDGVLTSPSVVHRLLRPSSWFFDVSQLARCAAWSQGEFFWSFHLSLRMPAHQGRWCCKGQRGLLLREGRRRREKSEGKTERRSRRHRQLRPVPPGGKNSLVPNFPVLAIWIILRAVRNHKLLKLSSFKLNTLKHNRQCFNVVSSIQCTCIIASISYSCGITACNVVKEGL